MLVAMSLSLCGMCIVIPSVMSGAGRHAAYLDPEVNKLGLKVTHHAAPTPPCHPRVQEGEEEEEAEVSECS